LTKNSSEVVVISAALLSYTVMVNNISEKKTSSVSA
jgi:hypothetical protein